MIISFVLLFLGLLLILMEFFLPGIILGALGGVSILASFIFFGMHTTSLLHLALFIVFSIMAVALVIKFALWRIVHAKPDYSIYSSSNQTGYQASHFDPTLIGKTGRVITDLKPGGYITIEGKQHQAISISGYIPKGEEVLVISGQEESLVVKHTTRS